MRPDIHWIETQAAQRLAIMARPRAGDWLDDEIVGWRREGVDVVVSLLEAEEIGELGLRREAELCRTRRRSSSSRSQGIPDRGAPASLQETASLAQSLARQLSEGKAVAIHSPSRDWTIVPYRRLRAGVRRLRIGCGLRDDRKSQRR